MKGKREPVSLRSDSESSDEDEDILPSQEELNERFSNIVESVERLSKIVSAIRDASRQQSRDLRGAAYVEWEDGINMSERFENYVGIVLDRRPDTRLLHPPLRQRLKQAIGQRQRQFAYQQRHQQKLYGANHILGRPEIQTKVTARSGPVHPKARDNMSSIPTTRASPTAEVVPRPTALSHTVASTFDERRLVVASRSSTITGSSATSAAGHVHDAFPPPRFVEGRMQDIPCPYCHQVLAASTLKRSKWR
jgi:hypothetical protein